MNCPKCQKKLPANHPRICPNCRKDLSSFYKMKDTQTLLEAEKEKTMKRKKRMVICLALALVCVLAVAAVLVVNHLNQKTDEPAPEAFSMEQVKAEIDSMKPQDFTQSDQPTDYVKLTVKDFGEIVVKLRPDVAPLSVQNFKDLVAENYYSGTLFHRVYPGFMIQGGEGEKELSPIKGEFSSNGVENPLLHIRGVLSMARTTVKDSATSQFFLMHAANSSLDGNYAAFGYIVAGLDTVDKICEIPLGQNPYNGEMSVPQVVVRIDSAVFVNPKQ